MTLSRPWVFGLTFFAGVFLGYLFIRYGIYPRETLAHTLTSRIIKVLPGLRWTQKLPYLLLCISLILMGFAAAVPRWGTKTSAEYEVSRVIGLLKDVSGSIDEAQKKLFVAAAKRFFGKFRESAMVSIGPFADRARPSPLFTLVIPREYDAAMVYLDRGDEIDVGAGTEGGWALYQMFHRLMVPSILSDEVMRNSILPWLKNREIREHERELVGKKINCRVRDRAVIVETDAMFSESRLHSAEILELYRICGVRAYIKSVKGERPSYLVEATQATGGRFMHVPAEIADDEMKFGEVSDAFFNDIFAVERAPQKVREVAELIPRSWIFVLASLAFAAIAAILMAIRLAGLYRRQERRN